MVRVQQLEFRIFFFTSTRRHTSLQGVWSSDVCSSDLPPHVLVNVLDHVFNWPVLRCPRLAGFGCPPRSNRAKQFVLRLVILTACDIYPRSATATFFISRFALLR